MFFTVKNQKLMKVQVEISKLYNLKVLVIIFEILVKPWYGAYKSQGKICILFSNTVELTYREVFFWGGGGQKRLPYNKFSHKRFPVLQDGNFLFRIFRYIHDFLIMRFPISRFHCRINYCGTLTEQKLLPYWMLYTYGMATLSKNSVRGLIIIEIRICWVKSPMQLFWSHWSWYSTPKPKIPFS